MNKDETIAILAVIRTAYPNFYRSAEEIDSAIDLWTMMFVDETAKIVTEAVKALICTNKYPPTIADVKEKIALITQPQQLTEMEAWGLVLQAIQDSNYHAQIQFNKLPAVIQKVIGSANQLREWGMLDKDSINAVVQSNFMRSYKTYSKNERELALLPQSTLEYMKSINIKLLRE